MTNYSGPGYRPAVIPTSGLATTSMIMGIGSFLGGFVFLGIPCLVAIIAGHMALKETKYGLKSGHGQAVAGLWLGYLMLIPALVIDFMVIAFIVNYFSTLSDLAVNS